MSEIQMAERSLPKEELSREAYGLYSNYKVVLMKSPAFQRASALALLSDQEITANSEDKTRLVEFRLSSEHGVIVKYDPRKSISVELRGDDDTSKVVLSPDEPLIKWSYVNDDGRRKDRVYTNTRDAIGQANHFLNFLKNNLQPSA